MSLVNHAAELAVLVPFLASVYQIYLRKPLVVNNRGSVSNAMAQIRKSEVVELPVGTHNVTPTGARNNYTVTVTDKGDGDNMGILQVSNPDGNSFSEIGMTQDSRFTTETISNGIVSLNSDKGGGYVETIAEPTGNGADIEIFGLLAYIPKGQPVFPK